MTNEADVLPVILYHKCPYNLEKQLELIKQYDYSPVHLKDVINYFQYQNSDVSKRKLIITFDDGLQDFYNNAFPLLKDFNFKATICVPTGYISDDEANRKIDNWKNNNSSKNPTMTWRELKVLESYKDSEGDSLFEIIPHSVWHTDLNDLENEPERLRYEVLYSKVMLRDHLNLGIEKVLFFCLPYGGGWEKPWIIEALQSGGYAGALMVQGNSRTRYFTPRFEPHNSVDKFEEWLRSRSN